MEMEVEESFCLIILFSPILMQPLMYPSFRMHCNKPLFNMVDGVEKNVDYNCSYISFCSDKYQLKQLCAMYLCFMLLA